MIVSIVMQYTRAAVRNEYCLTVGSCCALIQVDRATIQLVKSEGSTEEKHQRFADKIWVR